MTLGLGITNNQASKRSLSDVVYLGWQNDPLTTMTVHWHTTAYSKDPIVMYKEEGAADWQEEIGEQDILPMSSPVQTVHKTELTGLTPDTGYEFKFKDDPVQKVRKFKTMPTTLARPLKIANAADCHAHMNSDHFEDITKMMGGTVAGGFNADIVIASGDFTYDDGNTSKAFADDWIHLLRKFSEYFVTSEGYSIPMVAAVGNHDTKVQKNGYYTDNDSPNFDSVFSFPTKDNYPIQQKGYGVLNFGDYLQLIVLDTEHLSPFEGIQKDWFDAVVDNTKKHVLPTYHVPMYGLREGSEWILHSRIDLWGPAFEQAGAKIALTGHMHNYSRTKPLLNKQVDPNGIVYCGSGTWSQLRTAKEPPDDPFYMDDAKFSNIDPDNAKHFWGVTLFDDRIKAESINSQGVTFHEFERMV